MSPSRHLIHTLAGLALLCSAAAQAQGIWRCGPQGNSFSDRPCADGHVLTTAPAPSTQAVQQAADVARREATLAVRLRAQRLAQEQQFQRSQLALHEAAHQGYKSDSASAYRRSKGQQGDEGRKGHQRQHADTRAADSPRRVATGPAPLNPRAARARSAAADARTSAAAARGLPAKRD